MKHSKQLIITASALLMLFAMSACGESAAQPQQSAAEPAQTAAQTAEPEIPEASATETEAPAEAFDPAKLPAITLSSENLHDGVWDDDISNTDKGSNRSPQLSWEPVEGAACYAVYMVDITVTNWLHWKSGNVAETTLPAGWAPETEYVGPYPPSGTHDYEIRVFALKEAVTEEKSKFDNSNYGFEKMTAALDQGSSGSGNVLAYGTLTGSFTRS